METNCQQKFLSIANIAVGKPHKIWGLDEELPTKYQTRLLELGFLHGENVVVLQKSLKSKTFLVAVAGVGYSLQKKIAECVLVEEI